MRSCPQCRLMLEEVEFHDHALWCCRSCGGTWIAHADLAGVLIDNRASLTELDEHYGGVASAGFYEGLTLPCAQCAGRTLAVEPVPGVTGVSAPACPSCGGVWLVAAERRVIAGTGSPRPAQPAAAPATAAPEPPPTAAVSASREVVEQAAAPPSVVEPAPVVPVSPRPPVQIAPEVSRSAPPPEPEPIPATAASTPGARAVALLMEGNRRFVAGAPMEGDRSPRRRAQVAAGQHPCAAVVCCSDSRVAPEIVFDQGLGDLFVVRAAGQVLGDAGELSLEYAVDHCEVPLILVLGHSSCGAVKAAVAQDPHDTYLAAIVDALQPALDSARFAPGDPIDNASRANVQRVVRDVRQLQPIIAPRVGSGGLEVVGAFYDLVSGNVTLLPEPEEEETTSEAYGVGLAAAAPPPHPALEPESASLAAASVPLPERVICPRCLTEYPPDVTVCEKCGVEACGPDEEVPCPRCSVHNPVRAQTCRACNLNLRSREALDALYPPGWDGAEEATTELAPAVPPVVVTMPEPAQATESRRWCPHCRRAHPGTTSFCTQCGIALVEGDYLVACGHCRSLNPISADRCRACTADLHPGTVRSAPPPVPRSPFDLSDLRPTRTSSTSVGCGTISVLMVLAVLAVALAAFVR